MPFTCNHHKADTCIVLQASRSIQPVIIIATDTDFLVLSTHAYTQCNNVEQWLMKTNPGIFIDIKTICNFLETVFVKLYQDSKVLVVVIQPPAHLVLEKLALLRKCVVSAKCICYKMWKKTLTCLKG